MMYDNWTDDSAFYQAKNGTPGATRTLAAWSYIESRLQGCDQALANARIDDPENGGGGGISPVKEIFGHSNQPKRQSSEMENRVAELMADGYTQDQALDIAEAEIT